MEYKEEKGREVVMRDLHEVIGQWPYWAPSVFSFYAADYQPQRFSGSLVAPEFQIFTPPNAVGLLNGLMSFIHHGELSSCDAGFGLSWVERSPCGKDGNSTGLPLPEEKMLEGTLALLSMLLTGGRLGDSEMALLRSAYKAAPKGKQFQAAQVATVMMPQFHTLGAPLFAGLRAPVPPPVIPAPKSYKATVLLFLWGGADSFNLIVPLCDKAYAEYTQVRGDVALSKAELLHISAEGQACASFGVHHDLPFLTSLYDTQEAAFVSNVGGLIEPLTKEQFQGWGAKCHGLFSHVDQQQGAQSLKCQVPGAIAKGAGGRIADALAANKYRVTSFSVAGTNTWSQGFHTNTEVIAEAGGAVRLVGYSELLPLIENITMKKYGNIYSNEYALQFGEGVESSKVLADMLDNATLETDFPTNTSMARQLRQVARLIKTRDARKAERDFFFVQLGSFDTHTNTKVRMSPLLQQIDGALNAFVKELRAQHVFDATTLLTESDFGRTLTANSNLGTDHAYAGNYIVLGGAVKGGRIFNDFPKSLAEGNEQDVGRGRMIPKYPWENMMVPVAEWMGVEASQHGAIFPNLKNFNRTKHIIPTASLFKATDYPSQNQYLFV